MDAGWDSMDQTEVIARATELRRLAELLAGLSAGSGGGAVIEGEPGAGKSALLQEALVLARARGLRLLAGRVEPGGHSPRTEPPLADLIRDAATPGSVGAPAVLALDDLHWADREALAALARLAEALPGLPLVLVCTAWSHPRAAALHTLIERLCAVGVERLRLGPLPDRAVTALAARVTGASPGARLRRQLSWAGGNPRLVTELLAALLAQGAIRVDDGIAEVASTTLPLPLRATLLGRLGLPEETLHVLRVAAVLGSPFSVGDLCGLLERRAASLLPVVRAAIDVGVIVEDDARLVFRHELLRQAFFHDVPAAVRAALEAELGRVIAATSTPLGRQWAETSSSGWNALTDTEMRVVRLVTEGHSNPEIAERMSISRRTVQTHVSHALAKVGLRSRVELAIQASRRLPS